MAKIVFGMQLSLDGYVDHMAMGPPAPDAFRHFTEHLRGLTGMVYGRRMYEVMRYWDDDQPEWDAQDHEFAALWQSKPKWVVSRTLKAVGPNATLFTDGVTEQENESGDEFSLGRLKEVILSRETEPAAALVAHISEAVYSFAGTKEQADDLTVVVAKVQ